MRATFTPEQEALADAARDLASDGLAAARAVLEGGERPDEPTKSLFEGFGGLGVPEDRGGLGGGLVDLAIVVEALGRSVTPTPFVAHALALQFALGGDLELAPSADPAGAAVLALHEPGTTPWGPWSGARGGPSIGARTAVPDGAGATSAVVGVGDDGIALVEVTEAAPRSALDRTRPAADLTFAERPLASSSSGAATGLRRACAVVAAELAGVGHGAVELAAEFAKTREQFGQPIGRFQGVAHQLADAWTGVEGAWSLALYACWAVDDGVPDAARAVHAAKAKAGAAAIYAAERCTQAHGGIGITWEADPHLFLRRALADDVWLGAARWHRRRVADDLVAVAAGA